MFLEFRNFLNLNQKHHEKLWKKETKTCQKTWFEGNNALCFVIPSEIVKKLELNQDSFLYVELVDNLIVMKKHDPKLTSKEKTKSKTVLESKTENTNYNIQTSNQKK